MNYAAVLCFLFEEREAVYFALRAMFARCWCRLNVVNSGPGMLLRLLRLFEVLYCCTVIPLLAMLLAMSEDAIVTKYEVLFLYCYYLSLWLLF